jgi:hypothetical protein
MSELFVMCGRARSVLHAAERAGQVLQGLTSSG